MTTDPTPDGVAAAHADATDHLAPRAVRPIDIEHDELMARAAAEHQARVTADQARATDDRAAAYQLAADAIERMQGYPHLILPEEIVEGLRLLAAGMQPEPGNPAYSRRLAAGERDEQQTQQGGHSCGNCEGIAPSTCLTNPDRDPNAPDAPCPTPETHNWGCGCPSDVAAAIASCPGREMDGPSPCRCPCEGCKHNCGAHNPFAAPAPGQPPADTGEEARPAVVAEPGEETGPAIPCSWAATRYQHSPHDWTPQPSMDPVHCPGHSFTEEA